MPNPIVFGESGINLTYLIAMLVFLVASLTDFLDGYLARKRNEVTTLGKFLDPIADKLLVDSMLIYLAFSRFDNISINLVCTILMIARDLVVDAFRQVAASRGKVLAASYFGKVKTVTQMAAIVLLRRRLGSGSENRFVGCLSIDGRLASFDGRLSLQEPLGSKGGMIGNGFGGKML